MVRIGPALLLLAFFTACATTTIQTGGSQGAERGGYAERASDPEANFFQELSDQDDAFDGQGQSAPTTTDVAATTTECPCDVKQPLTTAENLDDGATAATTADSYFDPNQAAQEAPTDVAAAATDGQYSPPASGDFNEVGTASWYGRDFDGKPTASGETFDSRKLTAAHKKIPLGSIVLVRNLENNREALVTINDRGPFVKGRVLDLSEYGAELLGYKEQGLTTVGIRVVRRGNGSAAGTGATRGFFDEDGQASAVGSDEADLNADTVVEDGSSLDYSLQVGAFSDLKNARNLERYLKHYGHPMKVVRRDGMFAVRIGKFGNRSDAEQLKARLTAEGYSAFVSSPAR